MMYAIRPLAIATVVWTAFAAQDGPNPGDRAAMVGKILEAWQDDLATGFDKVRYDFRSENGVDPTMRQIMEKFIFTVRGKTNTKTAWKELLESVIGPYKNPKTGKLKNPKDLYPATYNLLVEFEQRNPKSPKKLFRGNCVPRRMLAAREDGEYSCTVLNRKVKGLKSRMWKIRWTDERLPEDVCGTDEVVTPDRVREDMSVPRDPMIYKWNQWLLNTTEAVRTDTMTILTKHPEFFQAINGMKTVIKHHFDKAETINGYPATMSQADLRVCWGKVNSYIVSCLYEPIFSGVSLQLAKDNNDFRTATSKLWTMANDLYADAMTCKHENSSPGLLEEYWNQCHRMFAFELYGVNTVKTIGYRDQYQLLVDLTLPCIRGGHNFLSRQLQKKLKKAWMVRNIQNDDHVWEVEIGVAEKKGGGRRNWSQRCWVFRRDVTAELPEVVTYYKAESHKECNRKNRKGSFSPFDLERISYGDLDPQKIKKHEENPRIILNLHTKPNSEHEGRIFNLKFSTVEDMNGFWWKLCAASGAFECLNRVEIDRQNGINTFAADAPKHAKKLMEEQKQDPSGHAQTPTRRKSAISAASGSASADGNARSLQKRSKAIEPRKPTIPCLSDDEIRNAGWEQLIPYAKSIGVKIPTLALLGELQARILKKHKQDRAAASAGGVRFSL